MLVALFAACGLVVDVASAQTVARQTAIVTANAPIYAEAAVSPTPLRVAAPGTVLRVLQQQAEWVQIEFNDPQLGSRLGWVQRSLVNFPDGLQPMDLSVPDAVPATAAPSPRPLTKPKPCLIVKIYQKKGADAWTRWTTPKPYNYVEGDLPVGVKFRNELSDGNVREIQQRGGHVVIMKADYALPDLEDARRSCKTWQEANQ